MKKALYLICFIGLCQIVRSQSYYPIPTDSVYWVEWEGGLYGSDLYCYYSTSRCIFPVGNITIQGNIYTEFHCNSVTTYGAIMPPYNGCPSTQIVSDQLYAFLRNDTTNRLVLVYDTFDTHQDIILYDFDLSIGDTLPSSWGPPAQCGMDTFTVASVDSVDIGGEYRRRFGVIHAYLQNDTIFFIEGIGSEYGFVNNIYCPFEQNSSLTCFHYLNYEYFPNFPGGGVCDRSLGVQEELSLRPDFLSRISDDLFYISNDEENNITLNCSDMLGRTIRQYNYHESGYLNLEEISGGTYILSFTLNGKYLRPLKINLF